MPEDEKTQQTSWVERVKTLMPERGIHTYQDLAFHSGVSAGSLNQAMRGMHMPRQKTIEKIAHALDTTPQFLLYGDNMKVVQKIPFIRTPEQLGQWLSDVSMNMESLHWIEMPGNLTLSRNAFAVECNHHDLEPMFMPGDVIVFERLPEDYDASQLARDQQTFVLAVRVGKKRSQIHDAWLLGRYMETNHGSFVTVLDQRYDPVPLDQHCKLVGLAVHQMRSLHKMAVGGDSELR